MRIWPFSLFETKSLASPDAELLEIFGARQSSPLNVPAVANATCLIAEGVATQDIALVKRGSIADHVEHPVLDLLRGDFNPWLSAYEGKRDLISMALLHDAGGIAWVNRVDGKPVEILVFAPDKISVTYADTGEPSYKLGEKVLALSDIVHVRSPFGQAPVNLAKGAIDTASALESHARRLFENGAKPGAVVQIPKGMGEDAIKKMKSSFRVAYEGKANAAKTVFVYDGVTFTSAQMTSVDAQFVELRRFAIEDIARAFNMSASMIGDLTKSSYANQEQKSKEFLNFVLEPWLCAAEAAFNRALLSDEERKTLTFRFDRDDLSRVDLATRANAINSLIASEVINPNTGASWLGLPPHDGGEDYGNRNITVKPPKEPE